MKRFVVLSLISVLFVMAVFASYYPVTLVDDAGNVVTIQSTPMRVIDAAPSVTDFMLKLGYADRIVGVTQYDAYTKAQNIGLLYPLDLEKIISLKPDIVFLFGGFQLPQYASLKKLGVTSFVLNANSLNGVYRDVMDVATIMGDPQRGEMLVNKLQSVESKIENAAYTIPLDKRPTVFYGTPGKEIWTAGMGSFLNEIISLAGGVNITGNYAGPNGWLPVSPEFVVAQNPDIILVPYYVSGGEKAAIEQFDTYPPFADLKAVKMGHVYAINGNIASQPNTQLIDLLQEIYDIFQKW
ncbi:ABC transporter substrate-binding protein [Athalassotoga sp.]|uniref:ABC transporter substrate-binding protein n=1 Tax=Athalassotoga sp. TaxID=2022597 RepID=UPI003D07A3E8